jgi:predicted phage terminase large subunit-like protein
MQQYAKSLPQVDLQKAHNELARRHLLDFTIYLWPQFKATQFHTSYYKVLHLFAIGKIKKLIVTIPPQHGKSQGSSKYLPAYMLGVNPDLNIALMSYSATYARKFNRHLQKTMLSERYSQIFDETKLGDPRDGTLKTTDEFEIKDKQGSFKVVGREGALTGNPVDVMIFDDLYKDAMEGNSPIIRENVIDMYKTVAETRLHNDSQEICVFTRWHQDDLIGWFEKNYKVINLHNFDQINEITDWTNTWVKINYEAIKETEPTELDPREIGEPLFPERHSLKRLRSKQTNDSIVFGCMFQGDPQPKEGLLYGTFKTYTEPAQAKKKANYTDTADEGDDFLCSICYDVGIDGLIYVTDVLFTQEPMEKTEILTPMMMNRNGTADAKIESNNGGRGFARTVKEKALNTTVTWFHQSQNKEARILTNASQVIEKIRMPIDWKTRWPIFAQHLSNYKRIFRANKYDDAADTITGIIETEYTRVENWVV